jgi:hypothetical protein
MNKLITVYLKNPIQIDEDKERFGIRGVGLSISDGWVTVERGNKTKIRIPILNVGFIEEKED